MQQIADWLQKLGLGQYAQRFAENEIDVSVLPHLTDQDLKDIGVPLGPRRKILAAITTETGTTNATPEAAASIELKAQDTAERRQVTVMFSDLVGSTALSASMDPEDLREVISAYQHCVAETVRRFDGFIAKYMGDGVLVYFGYPEAHEDDPERAVRAALELIAAVGGLETHSPLQTRVGIASGLVVVGDLIGSGASQEQAIVGKTPNLAARLQSLAEPNTVVIAESTHRFLGDLFEYQDLGKKDLKGLDEPTQAWVVTRPSSLESRFEALHASGLTQLVGRQEELDLLLRRWSKVTEDEGQVVLLSGEPGIGKSRLLAALSEHLAAEPHTRLRYFCSPQHTDSALYPIISQLERAAGFTRDDDARTKLDKLDVLLARSFTPATDATLFADLLSLPNDGRHPTIDMAPQQRRQRTLEALINQIVAFAEQTPVLMIVEDIHWVDPTTLEALGRGIDRIKSVGVLLIMTYRSEFEPPWIGRPYVTTLTLNRLGEREIGSMIDRVAGNKALSESIRQDIIERTDGIPLFAEEMTKAVLEAESENDARKTAAAVLPSALAVPASLHASLMARLDRLGPVKEIGQVGAAIGREFSYALLAAVVRKPDAQIATLPSTPALRREQIELQVALIAPLIHVKGHSSPEVKSATEKARLLIENVEALGEPPENPLLLYSVLYGFWIANAVAVNGDALRTLAAQFLALAERQGTTVPLMVGHSMTGSSLLMTGNFEQSRRHSDVALSLYDPAVHRPLAMLFGQDVRVGTLTRRSLLLWLLGYPDVALADMNQALKEAREIGQAGTLLHTLNYATVAHFIRGAYEVAEALAKELFALADEKGALAVWKPAGLLYQGWLRAVTGRASEAVALLAPGLAALRSTGTTIFTPVGLSLLAKSYAALGQLDDAWRCVDEAINVIERTKETWFEADVHRMAGEVALKSPQPDAAKAEAYFQHALAVARQQQAKSWELRSAMSLARLWRDQGKPQQARELLAPIYGWFTEGFDTRDLKKAKLLLEELAS